MTKKYKNLNSRQIIFKEMVLGTLIYAVVLGFFNDYTEIVNAKSFSTIFFASIVLQILTILAFDLKKQILKFLKNKQGTIYKALRVFSVWLVMFLSKFVFVWVIDQLFGDNININGFFGILAVVVCVTLVHKLADYIFIKLGD